MNKTEIKADASLIAACGLYCGACRKYLKGTCPGCRENQKASWCKNRQCCLDKGYATCAECEMDVKACKIHSNFIGKIFALLFNSDRAACIQFIKENGAEAFAREMTQRGTQTMKRK